MDPTVLLRKPDILGCKRILCIQPHPDDNEIGMGGTIAVLAEKGCEIHYLTLTNGDQGNKDRAATPAQTAAVRHEETIRAGRHLGASQFYFLDYGDGTLSDVVEISQKIAECIRRVQPDAVFGPDPSLPYEAHYDHIIAGRAVANGFMMSNRTTIGDGTTAPWQPAMLGYYYTAAPNTVIDVTGTFDRKFEAIALHDSQMDDATMTIYRIYFKMIAQQLAQDHPFDLGEGLKVLGPLHMHCFTGAANI